MTFGTRLVVLSVSVVLALYFFTKALLLIFSTEQFYRPAGELVDVNDGWFRTGVPVYEVSLQTGQPTHVNFAPGGNPTSITGLSFSQNPNQAYCLHVRTEHGRKSVDVRVDYGQRLSDFCWRGQTAGLTITNVGAPQVIRYRYGRPGGVTPAGTNSICDRCGDMPTFHSISDLQAIRGRGVLSLGMSAASGLVGLVAALGAPTVLGFLYSVARLALPTGRARRVKAALHKPEATGETFDASATHEYNQRPTNAFRQQQDTDDMRDMTADIRAKTEQFKQKEREDRERVRKKEAEAKREKELLDDLEAKVKRVRELQEKAARRKQDNE